MRIPLIAEGERLPLDATAGCLHPLDRCIEIADVEDQVAHVVRDLIRGARSQHQVRRRVGLRCLGVAPKSSMICVNWGFCIR